MATDKIQTGIRFTEILLQKTKVVAKHNHRSLNAQVEMLAEECVAAFEKEHGEILLEIPDPEKILK